MTVKEYQEKNWDKWMVVCAILREKITEELKFIDLLVNDYGKMSTLEKEG